MMWNNKKVSLVHTLVSENYVHHRTDGSIAKGRDHVRNVLKLVFDSYSDIQWSIKMMVAENDMVATYIESDAKHPKNAHFKEAFYHRVKDGMIIEGWALPVKE